LAHIVVDDNEALEKAIKRFKRMVEKEGIIREYKKREYFEKPSTILNRKKKAEFGLQNVSIFNSISLSADKVQKTNFTHYFNTPSSEMFKYFCMLFHKDLKLVLYLSLSLSINRT